MSLGYNTDPPASMARLHQTLSGPPNNLPPFSQNRTQPDLPLQDHLMCCKKHHSNENSYFAETDQLTHPCCPLQILCLKMMWSKCTIFLQVIHSREGGWGGGESLRGGVQGTGAKAQSGSPGDRQRLWQNQIHIQWLKAIISFIRKINISLLSRHL